METIERDFAPKGVKFYYVYKALAHPEWDGYVTPFTLEERLAHIEEAKRTLDSRFAWLCDAMDNRLKHAMGSRPNSEFVVDPEGVIVASRDWSKASELRKDLEGIFGAVENPTTTDDLDQNFQPPPVYAAKGIIPRLKKPGRMSALQITPHPDAKGEPYYAKLRAEADGALMREGTGKLYLRFMMDQILRVHWNNLEAEAIQVRMKPSAGVTLSKDFLKGPQVDVPSDIDPREFIIDVEGADPATSTIDLEVSYFACNDEEGWCKPILQTYTITFQRNRDGGSVFPQEMNRRFQRRGGRRGPRGPNGE